jgi:hypothetical protein
MSESITDAIKRLQHREKQIRPLLEAIHENDGNFLTLNILLDSILAKAAAEVQYSIELIVKLKDLANEELEKSAERKQEKELSRLAPNPRQAGLRNVRAK